MDGISFLLSIGRPCWPKLQIQYNFFRLVVGPFALMIVLRDMDVWLANIAEKLGVGKNNG